MEEIKKKIINRLPQRRKGLFWIVVIFRSTLVSKIISTIHDSIDNHLPSYLQKQAYGTLKFLQPSQTNLLEKSTRFFSRGRLKSQCRTSLTPFVSVLDKKEKKTIVKAIF